METDKPLVAILTTVYNAEKTIGKVIDCISKQTYTNWQHHIVLNNSNKETAREVEQHTGYWPKFNSYDCYVQGHVPANNLGLEKILSSGATWVARCDSDDFWHPTKLEKQIEALQKMPEVDVLGTQMNLINRDTGMKTGTTNYPLFHEEIEREMFLGNNCIGNSSSMLRTDLLAKVGVYDELFPMCEDYWFWMKCLLNGYKFANHCETLVDYTSWNNPKYNPNVARQIGNIGRLIKTLKS